MEAPGLVKRNPDCFSLRCDPERIATHGRKPAASVVALWLPPVNSASSTSAAASLNHRFDAEWSIPSAVDAAQGIRYSEEQSIGILKEHEAGMRTAELCL